MTGAELSDLRLVHEIFVLDAFLTDKLDASKMETITNNLVENILSALEMVQLGKLEIYPAVDLREPGWSFIQPITTSHISGHYFESPGHKPHIRMDLYSCKSFDWRKIIAILNDHLRIDEWRASFINREIEMSVSRKIGEMCGKGNLVLQETELLTPPVNEKISDRKYSLAS